MKFGWSHIIIFVAGLIPAVIFMYFFNRDPIGPEIINRDNYLGCYAPSFHSILIINNKSVTVINENSTNTTNLKRILSIKNDDVINTEREIFVDLSNQSIEIGSRDTGFFYVFRQNADERSLILHDREGRPYQLRKQPC